MTDPQQPFKEELRFPLNAHFRIIAENLPNMHFVIETVLAGLGVTNKLETEKQSAQGKYQSFSVDIRLESKEQMNKIDAELRAIQGVKMVL